MIAEGEAKQFQPAQKANHLRNGSVRSERARKEKKIFREVDKNAEHRQRGKEWTRFERMSYARLLLSTILHSLTIGANFFECLGQELSRKPREVYCFHKSMVAEFRSKRSIVRELLGVEMARSQPKRQKAQSLPASTVAKREVPKNRPNLVDTSSSECFLDSQQLAFMDSLLIEKSPELTSSLCDEEMEIQDYNEEDEDFDCEAGEDFCYLDEGYMTGVM